MIQSKPAAAPDTLILGSEDVAAAFDWADAIAALRRQYGADISDDMFPPRAMARTPPPSGTRGARRSR